MRVFSVYEYIWCVRNKNNYINKIINNEQLANQYIDLIVCYFLVSVVPWKMWIEGVTRPLRTKRIVVFFFVTDEYDIFENETRILIEPFRSMRSATTD